MNKSSTQHDNVIAEIEQKALGELESYVYSIDRSSAHRSQSIWIGQMSDTYAGRVIIELVQNGHDAHPSERNNGRIHIELALDEGPFGTLYVANDGKPFRLKDFHSICDIGLSSKSPGEGIGNKGQGFRSVLSVSSTPEVYSASQSAPVRDRFHGFCFGFARPSDYQQILEKIRRPELFERAIKEKSPYSVPVPLFEQPERVKEFSLTGFATVIRLPLDSEKAFEDIRDQIKTQIVEDGAPILLFLPRVSSLVVKEIEKDQVLTDHLINKSVTPETIGSPTNEQRFELASIPKHGKYLIASAPIDHSQLMVKIKESLAYGLPTSWREWTSEARVEIAVRLDRYEDGPRFYNFLPMGEDATSPFCGHINAPFYTKVSREDLRLEIPINRFFLEEAGKLCARSRTHQIEAIFALRRA